MDVSFVLTTMTLLVIAVAIVIFAGVGVSVLCIAAWRNFTRWIAAGHVAEERQRAKARLKQEKRIASEREEALLKGASSVASKLVQTVVETQLQHLAGREADHRQQVVQLALLLDRSHNMSNVLSADTLNPSYATLEASPIMAQGTSQPRRRGLVSRIKSMFIADATSSKT